MQIKERIQTAERRDELVALCKKIYGCLPDKPTHLSLDVISEDRTFAAGKGTLSEMNVYFDFEGRTEILPIKSVAPSTDGKYPAIVFLGSDLSIPNKFLPAEEIVDRGYGLFVLSAENIKDSEIKRSSVLPTEPLGTNKRPIPPTPLMLTAWVAMRVVDFLMKQDCINKEKIVVMGHGMLGEAALLTAALDQRIEYVIANDSLSLGLMNDSGDVIRTLPELFTDEYIKSDVDTDPHEILLSLCSDRHILIGCCEDDVRSNPEKELKYLASLIKSGMPKENISYHSRSGSHYLSRDDWKVYLDYVDSI